MTRTSPARFGRRPALLFGLLLAAPATVTAQLLPGESHVVEVDAHTGDEATTEPKTDANDGRNGDNPEFQRTNVARAHLDYWYSSSFREAGEPDPAGPQYVDYRPPFGTLGTGRYRITTRYRQTDSRASYPALYHVHHATGTTTVEQDQRVGSDFVDLDLGEYDLAADGWVRVEDPGRGSITFFEMTFTFLGTTPVPGGRIAVAADGHGLEWDGRAWLPIGDSLTQGWMELGTDFDQDAWLQALADRGITVAMLWTYIGVVDQVGDERVGYDAPELWPWARAGGGFDLNSLNDAYFDRLRALCSRANERNLAVLITVHDGWTKTRFAGHPFNQALGGPLARNSDYVVLADAGSELPATYNAGWSWQQKHQYWLERFCARLIAATGDLPNVMYEMFNEGEWYDQTALRAFQVHFLRFFRARTAAPLLVNDDHVGGADFRGVAECDVLSLHRPNWDAATGARVSFDHFAAEFGGSPSKPSFFSEPVPEYRGDGLEATTRLMWGTALARAGFVVQNDLSFGFAPRSAIAARAADRTAVLDREGHCARFFADPSVSLAGTAPRGALASTGVCLARPGEEYVVYTQDGAGFTVDLSAAAGPLTARFYSPRRGTFEAPFSVTGGSATESFATPTAEDWVLHVTTGGGADADADADADVPAEAEAEAGADADADTVTDGGACDPASCDVLCRAAGEARGRCVDGLCLCDPGGDDAGCGCAVPGGGRGPSSLLLLGLCWCLALVRRFR